MSDGIEVRLNLDDHFEEEMPDQGRLKRNIIEAERETYLQGTFRKLVMYLVKTDKGLDPHQTEVYKTVKAYVEQGNGESAVSIRLFNDKDAPLDPQLDPGDIHLDDIVGNKVKSDVQLINMVLYTDPVVGYSG